ncbi:MAG TPA: hypothetical protein VFB78_05330 [Acidimicrobiales bacterium]|jgi:hypothetical protein|nr:hypothetical protein [Acidimicrobiales bacterium]
MAGPLEPHSPDWPAQAADKVVDVVDAIRDKTTVPLTTVARGIVYGLVVAAMGTAVAVLLAIAAVRFVDVWIPGGVWRAHLAVGIAFSVAGLIALRVAERGRKEKP